MAEIAAYMENGARTDFSVPLGEVSSIGVIRDLKSAEDVPGDDSVHRGL